MSDTTAFDELAHQFFCESHVMAPGKDVAPAMGGYDESLLRSKLFQMWKQRVELERKLREALMSNRLGWQEVDVLKAELAAVEQAVRNVAPIENNEGWISPDDAPPSQEDMKRYVVFNDDADPIVDAATLSEAVKQIINCWTNVSEAADVAMGRVEMYEKALESVGIVPCHEDKPMTWVRITENGETGYDSLQQIIDQLLSEATLARLERIEKVAGVLTEVGRYTQLTGTSYNVIHYVVPETDLDRLRDVIAAARATPAVHRNAEIANDDRETGLTNKFLVQRADGSSAAGGKHEHCHYFVLDMVHDKFAMPAMAAYAYACQEEYRALADDIHAQLGDEVILAYSVPRLERELREARERIARLEKEKLGALFVETVYKVALGTVSRAHAMMSVHDLAKRYGIPNPLATDTTPGIV